ncbi:MAG: T9SS type A sorting domain-containing protein [Chlorobi bacterium]|nr:T9SS type A sorting domain-containing protein [Chlorobiota bacterium]
MKNINGNIILSPRKIVALSAFLTFAFSNGYSQSNLSPTPLNEIKYWGYQIQAITDAGAVDSLIVSSYDMLVLEPTRTDWSSDAKLFDTAGMVDGLKNSFASDGIHRKLVIAYIDIGEAEDWRWYWTWSQDWNCEPPMPEDWPGFIITCDPDGWGGNYPVAFWDPLWKDIVIYGENQNSEPYGDYASIIDEVIRDGFDGIYLDWVEAFENEDVIEAAEIAGKDPAEEMIFFIEEMRNYAEARNPDFIIIQQNAASLCDEHPELFNVIDAIAQEAIWFDGDATDDWNDPNGRDFENDPSLTEYYLNFLNQYLSAGLPVFDCEYALEYSGSAYARSYRNGFIPYSTRRSLGKLTTTPPPGYVTVSISDDSDAMPEEYNLKQNYPNPFGKSLIAGNAVTTIEYSIPNSFSIVHAQHPVDSQLSIIDALGKKVKTLVDKEQLSGTYKVNFNASNLPSGVYFYTLKTNYFITTKKMLILN